MSGILSMLRWRVKDAIHHFFLDSDIEALLRERMGEVAIDADLLEQAKEAMSHIAAAGREGLRCARQPLGEQQAMQTLQDVGLIEQKGRSWHLTDRGKSRVVLTNPVEHAKRVVTVRQVGVAEMTIYELLKTLLDGGLGAFFGGACIAEAVPAREHRRPEEVLHQG